MFTSETPLLPNGASSLLLNQNVCGLRKKTLVADIRLVAPAEGAFRRAKMSAVTREVFSSLARDAVHSSRRLHGSTATVAGSDLAIAAMNYRPLGAAFSNPSAALLDETWIVR